MTDDAVIEARGLVRTFPPRGGALGGRGRATLALDDVSFAVPSGGTFAITGESGSGKSTLARLLVALDEPTRGDVLFRGRSLFDLSAAGLRAARRRFQLVFQDSALALNPRLSARRTIVEALGAAGVARRETPARSAAVAAEARLESELFDRPPHRLSGGQRQRVALARALAVDPDLLVLDEAVSALDLPLRNEILDALVARTRARRGALVLIAHDLRLVRRAADRVLALYRGAPQELGPVSEVWAEPLHPYVRALVAAAPADHPSRRRRAVDDAPPRAAASPASGVGCPYAGVCPDAETRCYVERPSWREVRPGRFVACHLV